ncbi:DUF6249 domain-containing protein [Rubrolithibacter danxiaensis]|uniref:DUF6249 domain-containing protein n=1 Tax=Rubrolithibacter danxiaensis TaxID=3390805 RepID=UPI003BF7FDDB
MNGIEMLTPILVPLGLFAMIFGIYYLHNKENMALIQNGINPKANKALPQPYQNLKWGLLLMGAGLGLFLAYILDHTVLNFPQQFGDDSEAAIYFSLIGIFGGLGLFISYLIEKKEINK